jgi:hypothetical protein
MKTSKAMPIEPYKLSGEIPVIGWDIPIKWCIDANDQCWSDDAIGNRLGCIHTPKSLISLAKDEKDEWTVRNISEYFNIPYEPDWMIKAREHGWRPPQE